MKKIIFLSILLLFSLIKAGKIGAQYFVYDDRASLEVYEKAFLNESRENLIEIIKDKGGDIYKRAAAISVIRERFFEGLTRKEKLEIEDMLRMVFRNGGSSFIRIEIAYALCQLDRARYFKDMLPFLIRRIDYENTVVSERAFDRAKRILEPGQTSKKEAEIALNILNKISRIERSQNATAYELSVKEKQELIVLTRDVLSKK